MQTDEELVKNNMQISKTESHQDTLPLLLTEK